MSMRGGGIRGQGVESKVKAHKTSGVRKMPVRHTILLGIVIFLVFFIKFYSILLRIADDVYISALIFQKYGQIFVCSCSDDNWWAYIESSRLNHAAAAVICRHVIPGEPILNLPVLQALLRILLPNNEVWIISLKRRSVRSTGKVNYRTR